MQINQCLDVSQQNGAPVIPFAFRKMFSAERSGDDTYKLQIYLSWYGLVYHSSLKSLNDFKLELAPL